MLGWEILELLTAMHQGQWGVNLPSEAPAESKELLRRITGTLTLLPKISTSAWIVSWLIVLPGDGVPRDRDDLQQHQSVILGHYISPIAKLKASGLSGLSGMTASQTGTSPAWAEAYLCGRDGKTLWWALGLMPVVGACA